MKFYVASSWRNEIQPQVVEELRTMGHEVYDFKNPKDRYRSDLPFDGKPPFGRGGGFQWSWIDKDWQNWDPASYREALLHPIAQRGFKKDFDAMRWADACIIVLPCGKSASVEAGWFAGYGKPVWAFTVDKNEPELMFKLFQDIICGWDEFTEFFEHIQFQEPVRWTIAEMTHEVERLENEVRKLRLNMQYYNRKAVDNESM